MSKNFIKIIAFSFLVVLVLLGCKKSKLNNLANETSPYLLQHASNPVNWYPWNANTLQLAKEQNKLILISIGYSSCHWCHVMEKESFSSKEVADFMNKNFINIKVDREERPDIDKIYLKAVELIANKSGWPLNCVTLPNGKPFWGGTYFTQEDWLKNLKLIVKLHKEEPEKIEKYANLVTENIQPPSKLVNTSIETAIPLNLDEITSTWKNNIDAINGGDSKVPKFPKPLNYRFLLRYGYSNKNDTINSLVNTTLTKMALGGIFDPIDGGFSRYATDKKWHIPHFEKMLYDNAQLVTLYSEAFQIYKDSLYKEAVFKTLSFIEDKLYNKNNGSFSSTVSAYSKDSNTNVEEEGAYYFWTKQELQPLIKEYNLFADYYNINEYGLWEKDKYVLIRKNTDDEFLKNVNISKDSLQKLKQTWVNTLQKERAKKTYPNIDTKVLTSWNALMLSGYAKAYKVFNQSKFKEIALKNATFIEDNLVESSGKVYRNISESRKIEGYLDDYANLINAYINLYEITFDETWILKATKISNYALKHFYDEESSLFYYSQKDKNSLVKNIDIIDGDIPSGNSVMANNLFILSKYLGNSNFKKISKEMLQVVLTTIETNPSYYSNWLQLYLNQNTSFYEVAVLGENATTKVKEFYKDYFPNRVLAASIKENSKLLLLQNKYVEDETLIYVCVDNACKYPTASLQIAKDQMSSE